MHIPMFAVGESHPLSLCRCICHVLCQLCMMTPIGVFEQLRWESEIQPQGLRSTAWWSLRIGIADATSKIVEKRGYPGIMISPTFCFVVPTSLIFFPSQRLEWFAHHILFWVDHPVLHSFCLSLCSLRGMGSLAWWWELEYSRSPMRRKDLTARSESGCLHDLMLDPVCCITKMADGWPCSIHSDLPLPWFLSNTEARNAALYQRSAWWEWAADLGRLTCWRYAKMRFP